MQTDITKAQPQQIQTISTDSGDYDVLLDTAKFNQVFRAAKLYASSTLVPDHYKNQESNCFLAIQMAKKSNVDIVTFMQKTYVVGGKMGIESQLIIALVNARGPFTGPIQWKFSGKGDSRSCTAFATHGVTGEVCEMTVDWATVKAEGWASKRGSKWLTMPDMMFRYRSASWLVNLYCPEVKFGLMSSEELHDSAGLINKEPAVSAIEDALPPKKVESAVTDTINAADTVQKLVTEEKPKKRVKKAESVPVECRFVCNQCSFEDDVFAVTMKGDEADGWKCIKCFSTDVADRRPDEGHAVG